MRLPCRPAGMQLLDDLAELELDGSGLQILLVQMLPQPAGGVILRGGSVAKRGVWMVSVTGGMGPVQHIPASAGNGFLEAVGG